MPEALPPGQFDLRHLAITCPGPLGWLGGWGYLLALGWLPFALWRTFRGVRSGVRPVFHELSLMVLVVCLIAAVQVLFRGTPLKYEYPLF